MRMANQKIEAAIEEALLGALERAMEDNEVDNLERRITVARKLAPEDN